MNLEVIDTELERTFIIKEESLSKHFNKFEEILINFVKEDSRDVIIDLSSVQKIDSMSLATLLRIKKKLGEKDRSLNISNPNESVVRILELAGLDSYLLD